MGDKIDSKMLSDLVNKTWRLVNRNCNGGTETVTGAFLLILEKALSDADPSELREAIVNFDDDCTHLFEKKKSHI